MNKTNSMKNYGVEDISRWADLMMDASDEGMIDTFVSMASNARLDIRRRRYDDAALALNRLTYLFKRCKKNANTNW